MRQIVLDTETTGISHEAGHRIIEIGCVELVDRKLTGKHFHTYLNPEREVDAGAFRVHGLGNDFLKDKPLFKQVVADFLAFIQGSELIIHNATFDLGFLNAELQGINWPQLMHDYCTVCDTLELARKKHPGQRNSLDALCKRYEIDHFNRELHGALLDAEILACVYLVMTGGQANLFDPELETLPPHTAVNTGGVKSLKANTPVIKATQEEMQQHLAFLVFLKTESGVNLWEKEGEEIA